MKTSWQTETGHLQCHWSGLVQHIQYNPPWIQETPASQTSYLQPIPNFAAKSPFGGASWFQPSITYRHRNSEI